MSRLLRACALLALLTFLAYSVWQVLPPAVVHIATGPVGGSFHQTALRYAAILEQAGFETAIHPNPQSLQIVEQVDARGGGGAERRDVGFAAQGVDAAQYPQVRSLGVIELQPLFLFVHRQIGLPATPSGLLGKRLVMPPEFSATAQAAREVLALYGVTPQNTRFTYLPIAEAAKALQGGGYDAGLFMLGPSNPLVLELGRDPDLVLHDFDDAEAIARKLGYLKSMVLPRSTFDFNRAIPIADVALVGAPVNVIVPLDIHPSVLYALLDGMRNLHGGQTLVSNRGDFPDHRATGLPVHPLVSDWVKTGTPWFFKAFDPTVASLIKAYWLPLLTFVAIVTAYDTLRKFSDLLLLLSHSVSLTILLRLKRNLEGQAAPGRMHWLLYRTAERLLRWEKQDKRARDLLARMQAEMERKPGNDR